MDNALVNYSNSPKFLILGFVELVHGDKEETPSQSQQWADCLLKQERTLNSGL